MGSLAMRNPLKGFEKRIERQVAHYVRNPSLATLDPPPFRTRQGVGTTLRPARPRERGRSAYLRTTPTWYIRFPVVRVKAAHW